MNLKWRDAMAVAGSHFTPTEKDTGWPASMRPDQLAALQRPYILGGIQSHPGRMHAEAHMKAISDACKSGDLAHIAKMLPVKAVKNYKIREVKTWEGTKREIVYTPSPKREDVTEYQITAPAFAAWLAKQDEIHTTHIAAWCAALGIDGDTRPIVPPNSWAAQSLYGLQRCDETADGRLVRLAEVVAWLMQAREMPCLNAVELVCKALEQSPNAVNSLYLLSENGYANVMRASHSFFYLPIINLGEDYPEGTAEDKGLAGALNYMRSYWGKSSAPGAGNWCGQHVLEPLAVRLSLAHQLWDYGHRGDDVVQQSAPGLATQPRGPSARLAAVEVNTPPAAEPLQSPAPPEQEKTERETIKSVTWNYLVKEFKNGQYATAKEFYKGLSLKAGKDDSPFDKGEGSHAGSLFVRSLNKPMALKTLENYMKVIRAESRLT